MDFWQKARTFAEEATKRSQELTNTIGSSSKLSNIVSETAKRSKEIAAEASKRSQEITDRIGLSDIVSETAKRSKEIAAEASKRADQIKIEAIKRADQIKSLSVGIASAEINVEEQHEQENVLERFGVTEELKEFVKELTINTFQDFPLEDDSEMSSVPAVSNVSQDLTEWQAKHASLVLSTVKEISKFRYELCPRVMKERKFWRIYFILVNSHVAPYDKRYMEEALQQSAEQARDDKAEETLKVATSNPEALKSDHNKKKLTSSTAEQDLDVFLLGDDSDEAPDEDDKGFDDEFDKMVDDSDDEKQKQ